MNTFLMTAAEIGILAVLNIIVWGFITAIVICAVGWLRLEWQEWQHRTRKQ